MLVLNGVKIILKELLTLPILAYWTNKEMVNVEGTMVTLLFSMVFLTISMSNYLGLGVMRILSSGHQSMELDQFWKLVAVQACYQLLYLPLIFLVPKKIFQKN
jgi:hypothetical protein